MSVKDWTAVALLLIAAGGVVVNVAISVALRARDREDFERQREALEELTKAHNSLERDFSNLRGRLGEKP